MDAFLRDLKHTGRLFLQTPGFTTAAIAALALGIATNTAMFSVVNTVLLKPFAYTDPARIVMFQNMYQQGGLGGTVSPTEFDLWRQQTGAFQDVSAYAFTVANLTGEAFPEQVQATRVSADFFRLCGANALHGRTFTAEDDQPNAPKSVVLAYTFWQRRFAGDPQVIGRRMTLSDERYEIVGVVGSNLNNGQISETMLGDGHITIDEPPDVYIPFQLDPHSAEHGHYFNVAGRLKPGITLAAANAQLHASYSEYVRKWPDDVRGRTEFRVQPLQDAIVGGVRESLLVLLGAVAFVLLIACANVANLLLARASTREKELAIRAALGAGRARLVRQLLTESLILGFAGGLLGLLLAYWGVGALRALAPANTPRMDEVHIDPVVLAFTFAVSLLTGLVFGLAPAWHVARTDLRESLNEAGRGTSAAGGTLNLRASLVVSELALAVLLLVGAGLLIRSFSRLLDVSPGFQTQHLLPMELSLPEKTYPDGAPVQKFYTQLMASVKTVPGIQAAGGVSQMPLADSYTSGSVFFEDTSIPDIPKLPELGNLPYMEIDQRAATPEYFQAMEIPLVRGRLLSDADDANAPLVAVVDANFARRFWPHRDALGQRVAIDTIPNVKPAAPRWRTIVGVVGHVKHYSLDVEGREQIYFPHRQPLYGVFAPRDMTLAVRTSIDPASVTSAIREQVFAIDKGLPLYNIATMDQLVSNSVAQPRLNLSLLVAFALLALALAAVGVYGVMAYAVTQRTQEFGIRMALGASPADVLKQVFLEGGRLAALGLGLGLIAALALTRLMASMLYGVKPSDPLSLGVAAALLAVVAFAACYIPARRATRVDPLVALRYE